MKSKKQNKKYAKCPCCSTPKYKTEISICLPILEKLYENYKELKIDVYEIFIDNNFEWACDNCLKDKKAILANPLSQNSAWYPYLAYFDSKLICRNCNTDFTFFKEEKKRWYETLKFWIDSVPVNCLPCRKQIRSHKIENNTISEILKKSKNEISLDELKTVLDIYRKWDKPAKIKYYERFIQKRLNNKQ
jgi:hypothetical protein